MDSKKWQVLVNAQNCVVTMLTLAELVSAAAEIFGAPVRSLDREVASKLQAAGRIPAFKQGKPTKLPTRPQAGFLLSRLATDLASKAVVAHDTVTVLPCICPAVLLGDEGDGIGSAVLPSWWTHAASLPPGHSLKDMVAAILDDAYAGHLDPGASLLEFVDLEITFPQVRAEIRLSEVGRDLLAGGGEIAERLAPFDIKATYGRPLRYYGTDLAAQARDASIQFAGNSGLMTARRSIPLFAFWSLAQRALEAK